MLKQTNCKPAAGLITRLGRFRKREFEQQTDVFIYWRGNSQQPAALAYDFQPPLPTTSIAVPAGNAAYGWDASMLPKTRSSGCFAVDSLGPPDAFHDASHMH